MKYFAYGSNMDPERMRKRGINFLKREWAILKGWSLKFNKIASRNPEKEGYANIVKDNQGTVEVFFMKYLRKASRKLDKHEGYPSYYNKTTVRVNLKDGKEVEAVTYVAQPDKVRDGLKPSREYLNHLLKGCDLLSEEYCEKLRKWETLD